MNFTEYIEENTLRLETSRRGGGIEIDCSELLNLEGALMSAYQNYLGGGVLGSVQSSLNFESMITNENRELVESFQEVLKRYFHDITNADVDDYDEWASADFDSVQNRSASAY